MSNIEKFRSLLIEARKLLPQYPEPRDFNGTLLYDIAPFLARIDAALEELPSPTHSNIVLKQREDGKWWYAVTPGTLIFPMVLFDTMEAALDHADSVAEQKGWPPVNRPSSNPVQISDTVSYSGEVTVLELEED